MLIPIKQERQKSQDATESKRMHAELMEKIDTINILRESNATLRSQTEVDRTRIKMFEKRLSQKEEEIAPLKGIYY
jgi:nucleoprotein TPR